jgi:hypothetical protein
MDKIVIETLQEEFFDARKSVNSDRRRKKERVRQGTIEKKEQTKQTWRVSLDDKSPWSG